MPLCLVDERCIHCQRFDGAYVKSIWVGRYIVGNVWCVHCNKYSHVLKSNGDLRELARDLHRPIWPYYLMIVSLMSYILIKGLFNHG